MSFPTSQGTLKTESRVKNYGPESVFKYLLGPKMSFEPNFSQNPLFTREFKPIKSIFKLYIFYVTITNLFHFIFFFRKKKGQDTFSLLSFSGETLATLSCQTPSLKSR